MKTLLLPLALTLVAGTALACPGDKAQHAATPDAKAAVAVKPAAATTAAAKAGTKVAEKSTAEPRKTAPM